ncbi:hypothetical protein [Mucilaginibacter segetis]|uniref:Uncharacterized protein n=1 Tax=Mucilaginibacter segetis TaxID=2793071 RepID=A0A934PVM5_9SPHI|nr:hypothetical protein [Mucilaginibacter segetis]MBK0380371.1 hypothetical protein [Mucilaginibacter segetis]
MKIINTDHPVSPREYANYLRRKLNPLYKLRRHNDIDFDITDTADSIEILKPDMYDGFLFRLEFKEDEIDVIKTEHYTDDVNVLTLEDILNNLYMEYPGEDNISSIAEES